MTINSTTVCCDLFEYIHLKDILENLHLVYNINTLYGGLVYGKLVL